MVSIVYARKHCILKEVGYHLNIVFFPAVIWSMNSSYLKYFFSRYYALLFDISSSTFCIYCKCFIQKTLLFHYFCDFWPGGVPLGKRFKKGAKIGCGLMTAKLNVFVHREAFGTVAKNIQIQDTPKTAQNRHSDAQRGQRMPKREHFRGILGTFWGSCANSENYVPA